MNTSLSKGASGGLPYSRVSYSARPGRNGLYGKNPIANTTIETGIKTFAMVSSKVPTGEDDVRAMAAVRMKE